MPINSIIYFFEWFFITSFVIINLGYFTMTFLSISQLKSLITSKLSSSKETSVSDEFEIPVSILVPAFNESLSIAESIKSMLRLNYSKYEIIVINDGSNDNTLDVLKENFNLEETYFDNQFNLDTKRVKAYYQSLKHSNIRVIDKENGGKSDSLNAGLNISSFPLFCSVDADSFLEKDSIKSAVKPFIEDEKTIASGGTIRIANGCTIKNGELQKVALPNKILPLVQIVEYLHSFTFGRLGWVSFNALLILSGAFSLFSKSHVIKAGGYRVDTVGEDMELVLRLHKLMKQSRESYNISYTPNPICWTEVPEDLQTLKKQRVRWQIGLGESLAMNYDLFLSKNSGVVGFVAFPFMLFFEFLTPILEFIGYLFFIFGFYFGVIDHDAFIAFLLASIGLGTLISINAIALEELTFQMYKKKSYIFLLFLGALIENIGYRQLNSIWRLVGLFKFTLSSKSTWGSMKRSKDWTSK